MPKRIGNSNNQVDAKAGVARRRQIKSFVRKYTAKNGFSPSLKEIGEGVDLAPSAVREHLWRMVKDGEVTMVAGVSRSVRVK